MLKFFFKMTKNRFLRGPASEQKIAQKHGQNVIFSFCTEEKEDKKWSKSAQIQGVKRDRQNGLPRQFFTTLLWFYKKLIASSNLSRSCLRGSVSVFKSSKSTTKLVTAHAESIFRFGFGFLKTWGALVGLEWLGRKTHFMCGDPLRFPFMELYSNSN